MAEAPSISQLLVSWSEGDASALEKLTPQVQQELRRLARNHLSRRGMHCTLQPTALVNEAWLRLMGQAQPPCCENRSHFFGLASRLMRLILVDYARAHGAAKRGAGAKPVTLNELSAIAQGRAPDILEVNEALEQLAKIDERKAKVIELRYFGGMGRDAIATTMGLSLATVKRDLRLAEAWLRRFLA